MQRDDADTATANDLHPGPPATRDAILDAAESEFGRRGYSSTTIGGIASTANVSRPLVYRYFGDKPALYREVVTRVLAEWNDTLVAVADQSAPTTAHTISAVVSACLEWATGHPMLRGVLLRDHEMGRRVAGEEIELGRSRLPALIERVLRSGIERGDIRSDIDATEMARVLTEFIAAASLATMTSPPEPGAAGTHTASMIEVILHGVVVQP